MSTVVKGRAAEAAVLAALIDAGLVTLIPFADAAPYDLAVELPTGEIQRIQVKSGRVRGGIIAFNTCSTDHGHGRRPYDGRADVFAVHVKELGQVFVLPVEGCPQYVARLRLDPPRNNQRIGIRFAGHFTLDRWLSAMN